MIDAFREFINLIKESYLKQMELREHIKLFAYFIAAPFLIFFSIYYFVFFEVPPPRVSNVSIAVFNDAIKLSYDRSSYYGPEYNRDIIDWEIDNVKKPGLRNKMIISIPDARSHTAEVSCFVTGFDGFSKAKAVASNTLHIFSGGADADAVSIAEETAETTIQKIKRLQMEGEGIKIIADPLAGAASSETEALKEKVAMELKAAAELKNNLSAKEAENNAAANETSAAETSGEVEYVLKGTLTDIFNDSSVAGAVVALGSASATSDRWGGFELRSKKGTFLFTITSPSHYKRTITEFVHDSDEVYNENLIPKTFKIFDYDEVARPYGGQTRKWAQLPTVVIHNATTGPSKYVPDAKDKDAIRDAVRKFVAPEFN
ncbi:MAG TPA: hypothetical protein PKK26_19165, partial [Candidatus Wallbacteria bacterium]|nr:hypothetical protein [Candidatus Wallbacteria bacterium]